MKQTFDTNTILYGILKAEQLIASAITGGIYVGQRPDNSKLEDVVVNTIDLTQEYAPQIGASNVNIHVNDFTVKISGLEQKKANYVRLKQLSELVLAALRSAKVAGLSLTVTNQNTITEADRSQHFANIRINWNIHE